MNVHAPTLLLCSVMAMALSAALMAVFGLTQRIYRGYALWTLAQSLAAAGMALMLAVDVHPALVPLAQLLVLQWPVLVLAGLRRFHQREALPLAAPIDWALFAGCYLLWLSTWVARAEVMWRTAALSFGAAMLMLYAASLLVRMDRHACGNGLKTLSTALVACALVHGAGLFDSLLRPLGPLAERTVLMAGAATAMLQALVMVYLALFLTCERTQAELADSQRRLRELANTDMLTQVPNRRHFHELAARALAGSRPGGASLLMFDIDHFKGINDCYGHKAGDEALCAVSDSLRESLRSGDVAGRLGGDEFVVLLPDTPLQDALSAAQRIVSPLGRARPVPLGLSFGVVEVQAGETLTAALHRADQALYEAKRQGRSRAVVATGNDLEPVFAESMPLGLVAL